MTTDSLHFDLGYCLPISALGLSRRIEGALSHDHVHFVGQLVDRSEKSLLRLDNFGRKALTELKEALATRGLSLGTVIVRRPTDYHEFLELLAQHKGKALEDDIKSRGASGPVVAKSFRQARIISDVVERLDARFKTELVALVRKYKNRVVDPC